MVINFEGKPAPVVENAWIKKAVYPKHDLEEARMWLRKNWGDLAADGHRIHLDSSLTRNTWAGVEIPVAALEAIATWSKSKKRPVLFDSKELQAATKTAKAINKVFIHLRILGRVMHVSGRANGFAVSKVRIAYTGKEFEVDVNPKFLIDALSSMKGQVDMRYDDKKLVLRNGTRTAIIQQMDIR